MHNSPPFEVGERISPASLHGWIYAGLSGTPDKDVNASRRYTKGMWVLELQAFSNKQRPAKVLAVRTETEDKEWWDQQRRGDPEVHS